ncbi:CYTH domain-containing protein [Microbacter sp. GSS18]|nr:CYTH domain-containing protein [Microbacter sp. GSS18]
MEIEFKFEVDDFTRLPDWTTVPGVVEVGDAEVRDLDAQYLDTDDWTLAHAGYALRRRTGGPDAGWHLKGPREGHGRSEEQWPLTDGMEIPPAVRARIDEITDGELKPLARIRNTRTAYALRTATGELLAEFADDHVTTRDERLGTERSWREWEVELGPGTPTGPRDLQTFAAIVAGIQAAVRTVGGKPSTANSKLARALGF